MVWRLLHFYLFNFANMLSVSYRSILIISDTDKNYFSAKSLEWIGIMPVFYLLNGSFSVLIPFQLNNKYGIAGIIFRNICNICIACSGRQFLPLNIVVTVGIVCKFDNAAKTIFFVVVNRWSLESLSLADALFYIRK